VTLDIPFEYFVCGFESVVSDPVITKTGTLVTDIPDLTLPTKIWDTGIYSIAATGTTKTVEISK
jgi:hypothetical protein